MHGAEKVSDDTFKLIQANRLDAAENYRLALESFDEEDKAS